MTHRAPTSGACLCGAVRYTVAGPFGLMAHCHCSMCRKHHGSLFATFVGAPLMGFKWLSGTEHILQYPSSEKGRRGSCRHCGSVTPLLIEAMDMVLIPAGNLEGDLDIRPQYHAFVGSKAPWHTITDGLPQHEEYPPEVDLTGVSRAPVDVPEGLTAGSCLCGDVAFEVTGPAMTMRHCHCTRCRRGLSAAHATNVFYPLENLRYTRGADLVAEYRVPEARFFKMAFCRQCGGAAPRSSRERGIVIVSAGILDSDPGVRPIEHIYVGSKANWFDITDGLPQFEGAPSA